MAPTNISANYVRIIPDVTIVIGSDEDQRWHNAKQGNRTDHDVDPCYGEPASLQRYATQKLLNLQTPHFSISWTFTRRQSACGTEMTGKVGIPTSFCNFPSTQSSTFIAITYQKIFADKMSIKSLSVKTLVSILTWFSACMTCWGGKIFPGKMDFSRVIATTKWRKTKVQMVQWKLFDAQNEESCERREKVFHAGRYNRANYVSCASSFFENFNCESL